MNDGLKAPNSPPDWLPFFPFLTSQWDAIEQLYESNINADSYNVSKDWQQYEHANQHLDNFSLLRGFRKSRLAYWAYLDLFAPLEQHLQTMGLISGLADYLIQRVYSMVESEMFDRFGVVKNQANQPVQLHVFALGKLGTNELNYSSDVDLVFVYDESGLSDGKKTLSAEAYFTRFGQKLIQLLDTFTKDGRVYRVDMRLRPFGSAGPLVCTKNALVQYLVTEGRDWERFAWMRGRLICGDAAAVKATLSEINAFIYRKHLDYKVFDALAAIKSDIALEHKVHRDNLKLGFGGIRTIEFIVQSLQVVFGGRMKQLQGVSIYPQFSQLLQAKKLSATDCQSLQQLWLWLRKLENMVQIVDDSDTHELPEQFQLQQVFAQFSGYEHWSSLVAELKQQRQSVDEIFIQIFKQPGEQGQLASEQQQLAQQLIGSLNLHKVPRDTAQKVEQLVLATVSRADAETSAGFVDILKGILKRPNYILMLLKEQNVHNNILKLLQIDDYFKTTLQQYPVLFEQLFEAQALEGLTNENLNQQWLHLLGNESDVEQWLEQLRYFKLLNHFNLMKFQATAEISASQLSQQLTVLAEFILAAVIEFSFAEIKHKISVVNLKPADLMVIAYGSMATKSMKVTSDLDLVFVLDKSEISADERVFLHRWIKRAMHHLSSQMYHGVLYEIDLQLRPNGHSGPLITTRDEFIQYQNKEAWTWEHAAMVKSRLVYGSETQKQWHQLFRKNILCKAREPHEVDDDLKTMSARLAQVKHNKAHDADFALLAVVLKYAHQFPQLADVYDMEQLASLIVELKLEA